MRDYFERTWKNKLIGVGLVILSCLAALVTPEDATGSVLGIFIGVIAILSPDDITKSIREED